MSLLRYFTYFMGVFDIVMVPDFHVGERVAVLLYYEAVFQVYENSRWCRSTTRDSKAASVSSVIRHLVVVFYTAMFPDASSAKQQPSLLPYLTS